MELAAGPAFSRDYHSSEIWKQQITWRGATCWKCPLDLWSYQQIICATRPDTIVECGVAMGGTTLYLADVLNLLGQGCVIGIDQQIESIDPQVLHHPRITILQGNSVAPDILSAVATRIKGSRTMVILDSDHDTKHVLAELRAYADFVAVGCYLVCEDGILDRPDLPRLSGYAGPYAALEQFLSARNDFTQCDACVLGATFNPNGYLLRTTASVCYRTDNAPPPVHPATE
jgi:cephalosporin hydroxylase